MDFQAMENEVFAACSEHPDDEQIPTVKVIDFLRPLIPQDREELVVTFEKILHAAIDGPDKTYTTRADLNAAFVHFQAEFMEKDEDDESSWVATRRLSVIVEVNEFDLTDLPADVFDTDTLPDVDETKLSEENEQLRHELCLIRHELDALKRHAKDLERDNEELMMRTERLQKTAGEKEKYRNDLRKLNEEYAYLQEHFTKINAELKVCEAAKRDLKRDFKMKIAALKSEIERYKMNEQLMEEMHVENGHQMNEEISDSLPIEIIESKINSINRDISFSSDLTNGDESESCHRVEDCSGNYWRSLEAELSHERVNIETNMSVDVEVFDVTNEVFAITNEVSDVTNSPNVLNEVLNDSSQRGDQIDSKLCVARKNLANDFNNVISPDCTNSNGNVENKSNEERSRSNSLVNSIERRTIQTQTSPVKLSNSTRAIMKVYDFPGDFDEMMIENVTAIEHVDVIDDADLDKSSSLHDDFQLVDKFDYRTKNNNVQSNYFSSGVNDSIVTDQVINETSYVWTLLKDIVLVPDRRFVWIAFKSAMVVCLVWLGILIVFTMFFGRNCCEYVHFNVETVRELYLCGLVSCDRVVYL